MERRVVAVVLALAMVVPTASADRCRACVKEQNSVQGLCECQSDKKSPSFIIRCRLEKKPSLDMFEGCDRTSELYIHLKSGSESLSLPPNVFTYLTALRTLEISNAKLYQLQLPQSLSSLYLVNCFDVLPLSRSIKSLRSLDTLRISVDDRTKVDYHSLVLPKDFIKENEFTLQLVGKGFTEFPIDLMRNLADHHPKLNIEMEFQAAKDEGLPLGLGLSEEDNLLIEKARSKASVELYHFRRGRCFAGKKYFLPPPIPSVPAGDSPEYIPKPAVFGTDEGFRRGSLAGEEPTEAAYSSESSAHSRSHSSLLSTWSYQARLAFVVVVSSVLVILSVIVPVLAFRRFLRLRRQLLKSPLPV